ncbi:hypothetical protein IFM89_010664 [Coptis chinensis]|uniref:aspartate--tRNA ligase n=1 Tax=Coptis chinensis TaxID=261450 RepID=A0A835HC80_9MAGN|nr:hypothetical protein IFM89_010664 [Coptis chinensis]
MSTPPPLDTLSKKQLKKEKIKEEKKKRQDESAATSAAASLSITEDPLSTNYGDISLPDMGKKWTPVGSLNEELNNQEVLIRGRVQATRPVGKNISFIVLRGRMGFTVQCVLTVADGVVSRQMVKFASGLNKESFVDVVGIVSVPSQPIKGATQQVEVQVRKIYCINKSVSNLPINIEDAARSEVDIENALQAGEQLVRVNQDTRLNYRVLDIRTPANQGIFRVQSQVGNIFRQFLLSKEFVEIHTPKLIAGSSEGGSAVFRLDYKGQPACLAQSPQLHKQMAICGDFNRVFEVGPVFRAEDSFTHRHLCEFTGLDVEMEIDEHYSEVMDIVDALFVEIFDSLNEKCETDLEAIRKQYPFEPLKYLRRTLRRYLQRRCSNAKGTNTRIFFSFSEAGVDVNPLGDLNTETERKLGQLVLEKYGTEFYILHQYPLAVRPFYTMPSYDDPAYSNSFDVFIRGEEIISGAQRVHVPEFLEARAKACNIDVKTISTYIDAFSGVGSFDTPAVDSEDANVPSVEPYFQLAVMGRGKPDFVIDDQVGIECGFYSCVHLEIKYVSAGRGKGTVWDTSPQIRNRMYHHQPEDLFHHYVHGSVRVLQSSHCDSHQYGAPPHGGFGVGLERVVMLFCALNNIRKTSLFPRDPLRIAP